MGGALAETQQLGAQCQDHVQCKKLMPRSPSGLRARGSELQTKPCWARKMDRQAGEGRTIESWLSMVPGRVGEHTGALAWESGKICW